MDDLWVSIWGFAQSISNTIAEDIVAGVVSTALLSLIAVIITRLIAIRVALRQFVLGVSARKRDGSFVIALLPIVNDRDGSVRRSIQSRLETEFRAFGAMASSQAFEVLVVPFRARPDDHQQTRPKDLEKIKDLLKSSGADVAIWGWQVRGEVANIYLLGRDYRSNPKQIDFNLAESQKEFDQQLSAAISLVVANQADSVLMNPERAPLDVLRAVATKVKSLISHDAPALRNETLAAELGRLNLRLQEELGRRTEKIVEIESAIDALRQHRQSLAPATVEWAQATVQLGELIAATGWQVREVTAFSGIFADLAPLLDREDIGPRLLVRVRLLCAALFGRAELDTAATLPKRGDLYWKIRKQVASEDEGRLVDQLMYAKWSIGKNGFLQTLKGVGNGLTKTADGRFDQMSSLQLYEVGSGFASLLHGRSDWRDTKKFLLKYDSLFQLVHPSFHTLFQILRLNVLTAAGYQENLDGEDKDALLIAGDNLARSLLHELDDWYQVRDVGQYKLLMEFSHAIAGGKISESVIDHDDRIRIAEKVLAVAEKIGDPNDRKTTLAVTLNNSANQTGRIEHAIRSKQIAGEVIAATENPSFHTRYVYAYACITILELTPADAVDAAAVLDAALASLAALERAAVDLEPIDWTNLNQSRRRLRPWLPSVETGVPADATVTITFGLEETPELPHNAPPSPMDKGTSFEIDLAALTVPEVDPQSFH